MRRVEGKAKQDKLHSVAELVERAVEPQDKADVWSWCLIRHTSLTHAGARQSRMALFHSHALTHFPAPRLPQLFHHSLRLHIIPSQSHQSCSLPSTTQLGSLQQISIHAAIAPPTPSTHSSRAVPPCAYPPIHTCCPPANHFQLLTCRLPRPALLLAATLLGTKASAILSAVE